MKKVFYVILALFVLYFVLAFFGPSRVKAESSININRPPEDMRRSLGDFKFFHEVWSPWTVRDPRMKVSYSGEPGTVGHYYEWEGNKEVGSGSMKILGFSGDSLLQSVSFKGEGNASSFFITRPAQAGTDVTWGMVFEIGFLHRTPMLFLDIEKRMKADYEKGLSNLKSALEKETAEN